MNIFEKELHKTYEKGYVDGMEYYKRRLFRDLIEAIYQDYPDEIIEMLIKTGEFDENEVQEAYKYFKKWGSQFSPSSGIPRGKVVDWRVRSEIAIPTEKMDKTAYLSLTTEVVSGNVTEYISNLVGLDYAYRHLKHELNMQTAYLKDLVEEYHKRLSEIKEIKGSFVLTADKTDTNNNGS